jgi:iron complex outermembrane recepter protein
MRKIFTQLTLSLTLLLTVALAGAFAQTKIAGKVTDAETKEGLAGVNIVIKGKVIGTTTDVKGDFTLSTNTAPPFVIQISYVGYETQEVEIKGARSGIQIVLKEQAVMGQEVVVSASRVEETVLKSGASIEKLDIRAIQQTAAPSFYDALVNFKGVESSQQSLTFRSINTRGFNANGNTRMVQLIDGMDSQAPGLNFSVGNVAGISELDVESVELIPGAASALYGPNAINGILLMNSKSPFLYKGLSAQVKGGMMHFSNPTGQKPAPYGDFAVRWAQSWNDRIALKVNLAYLQAEDWAASNTLDINSNLNPSSTRQNNPNYNGVNVYGDETSANIQGIARSMISAGVLPSAALGLIPNVSVSRTGYDERDLADYGTKSLRTNASLHYRVTEKIEAVLQANYGFGTTVYTGADRYSIKNFNIGQYKLELKGDNFFLRGYTTQERSGDSYANGTLGQVFNEGWGGGSPVWFPTYVGAFAQAKQGGANDAAAHAAARAFADRSRPAPGSAEFNTIADRVRGIAIPNGAKFEDRTNLYHFEGMYNFKNQIKFVELLIGAHHRTYQLNSNGTIFADKDGRKININEYGAYMQAAKSFGDVFKLTGSIRYDKNPNFDGQFTPRISGVFTVAKDHNFRLSYQTAFRIPTTQDQYIDLKVPQARLIGGIEEFRNTYNLRSNPIYTLPNVLAFGAALQTTAASSPIQTQVVQIITGQVTAAVTPLVTNAVTAQVTAAVTPIVTAQVTAAVTAQVNAAVAAGTIPNTPAAIQAAIQAGVQTGVAATLPGEIQKQVAATLPGAIQSTVAQQLPAALAANGTNLALVLAARANRSVLQPYQFKDYNPERVQSFEIGYKALIAKKLFVDTYFYRNKYTNFTTSVTAIQVTQQGLAALGQQAQSLSALGIAANDLVGLGLVQEQLRQVYQFPTSSEGKTISSGWGLGLDYSLAKGYNVSGNISYNKLNSYDEEILKTGGRNFFNTPDYRWNISFGKRPTGASSIGFNVTMRHQNSFVWHTSFVNTNDINATVVPAFTTVDAQVSKKLKSIKSILKIGGSNIFNRYYVTSYGNPQIGGMYYVSLLFDELLN